MLPFPMLSRRKARFSSAAFSSNRRFPVRLACTRFSSPAWLTPLFATLTNHLLKTSKHTTLNLLPATLTDFAPVTPLFATLTKNTGGGGYPFRESVIPSSARDLLLSSFPLCEVERPLPSQRFQIRSIQVHDHRPLDQLQRNHQPVSIFPPHHDSFHPLECSVPHPHSPPRRQIWMRLRA